MKSWWDKLRRASVWTLTGKELGAYFGSAIALIFVGTFLLAALFIFFQIETFFIRGTADVRPLFKWMPVLMIFLVAALTMRQWSEEQRSGTLEILLTLPVRRADLVLGKFLAALALVGMALALTLFLPITVSFLGDLDWGPVVGGYVAALLMASAYIAIGLFISSRTDNQIVSLILTVLVCGAFYLAGASVFTNLVGNRPGEILRAIGTGSRFESIERGVIDLRDLIYYVSLTTLFLVLNVVSLDQKRWSRGAHTATYRWNALLSVALVGANVLALNTWLFPVSGMRLDLTAQQEYSLSPTTRTLLGNLNEPLLMRGYFSAKTHPLLAPLVPTIRDMMREYEIAGRGRIQTEMVDPRDNEELEAEANQIYGIKPVPFRVAGRYEESVINSYFNILIRYGDQSVVLGFQDLIEVQTTTSGQIEVRLRNLEYDLTRSIKKTVYGFQSLDVVFARIDKPIKLTTYVTPNALPEDLAGVIPIIEQVGQAIQAESNGRFDYVFVDPDAADSPVTRRQLYETYGLQPIAVSFFSADTYYLYMVLEIGDKAQVIYPSSQMSQADVRSEIEAALRRSTPGFLKTVGLWTPSEASTQDPFGGTSQPIATWQLLREQLSQSYTLRAIDLSSGYVPGDIDALVVVAPQGFTDKERFAIDQFLMRGGSVVLAAANYVLSPYQYGGGLQLLEIEDGLTDMLGSYGIEVRRELVMDPQNEPFPVQVQRQVGSLSVMEIQQVNYPFFVDVRRTGMSSDSPIVANLPAITLHWASTVNLDAAKNQNRQVTVLLQSSKQSWVTTSTNTQPDQQAYPQYGFPVEGEQDARPLAVSVQGVFESFFKGKPSPLGATQPDAAPSDGGQPPLAVAESSPETAQLVVIGSSEFLNDTLLQLSQRLSQERYLNNLQFMQNAIDWSVEDADLLAIRSRGGYVRLLDSLDNQQKSFWEYLNYALALIGVVVIGVVWNVWRRESPMPLVKEEHAADGGAA